MGRQRRSTVNGGAVKRHGRADHRGQRAISQQRGELQPARPPGGTPRQRSDPGRNSRRGIVAKGRAARDPVGEHTLGTSRRRAQLAGPSRTDALHITITASGTLQQNQYWGRRVRRKPWKVPRRGAAGRALGERRPSVESRPAREARYKELRFSERMERAPARRGMRARVRHPLEARPAATSIARSTVRSHLSTEYGHHCWWCLRSRCQRFRQPKHVVHGSPRR